MKILNVVEVEEINSFFNKNNIDYKLKICDACGNTSYSLLCTGKEMDITKLCKLINDHPVMTHKKVVPGTIYPYNIKVE